MNGELFVVISTPNSKSVDVLSKMIDRSLDVQTTQFILPAEEDVHKLPSSQWDWKDSRFSFKSDQFENAKESILFLSNQINLADQMAALHLVLQQNKGLELVRILTFIDSHLLSNNIEDFEKWTDACAHFSDAICFANRENQNSAAIKQTIERYRALRYPMVTFILPLKKDPPLNEILTPVSLRNTHIFDSPEILEPEDSPENDPYLAIHSNGLRKMLIPILNFS